MEFENIDLSKYTTEKLQAGIKTYKECLKSSFEYGDRDLCLKMIELAFNELEKRGINEKK